MPLNVEEFPGKLQKEFEEIMNSMENYTPRNSYEGIIFEKKFPRMRNSTAQKIAKNILTLLHKLQEITLED